MHLDSEWVISLPLCPLQGDSCSIRPKVSVRGSKNSDSEKSESLKGKNPLIFTLK